ncbi:MAG: GIY-YIG nuclease family protein [Woeseiaceae bacterium]
MELFKLIPNKHPSRPALPLILAAWHVSTPEDKRRRLREHIKWAGRHGALDTVWKFLDSLREDKWVYLRDARSGFVDVEDFEDGAYHLSALFEELVKVALPASDFEPPRGWGIYAWFLRSGTQLCGFPVGPSGLIYVGRSNDLARRDVQQHLMAGRTPASSLRRSLGALLKVSLSLKAIPRSSNPKDGERFSHYGFTRKGEETLSRWMQDHLNVAAVIRDDPGDIEPLLIRHKKPLLCLIGWPNPNGAHIKALRRICSDEARAHEA